MSRNQNHPKISPLFVMPSPNPMDSTATFPELSKQEKQEQQEQEPLRQRRTLVVDPAGSSDTVQSNSAKSVATNGVPFSPMNASPTDASPVIPSNDRASSSLETLPATPPTAPTALYFPQHPLLQFPFLFRACSLLYLSYWFLSRFSSTVFSFWWFLLLASSIFLVASVVVQLGRSFAARHLNLHYRSARISLALPGRDYRNLGQLSLCVSMEQVTFWVVWFEMPGVNVGGGLEVPFDQVYREPPFDPRQSPLHWLQSTLNPFYGNEESRKKTTSTLKRNTIERWEESHRLLLHCCQNLTLRIGYNAKTHKWVTVHAEGLRVHLPKLQPETEREQKRLYPDGYPNLVAPIYEQAMRFPRISRWILAFVSQCVGVSLEEVEIYSIPHAFGPKGDTVESRDAMAAPIQLLSMAIRTVKSAVEQRNTVYVENIHSIDYLTAVLGSITMDMGKLAKEGQWSAVVSDVDVFSNVDHLPSQKTTKTWSTPAASLSSVRLSVRISDMGRGDPGQRFPSTPEKPRLVVVPLAPGSRTPCLYSALAKVDLYIAYPYRIDPTLVQETMERLKNQVMEMGSRSSSSLAKSVLAPITELWWTDLAIGKLATLVTGNVVSGIVDSYQTPIEWKEDLALCW